MAIKFVREKMTLRVVEGLANYSSPGYTQNALDKVGEWCYEHKCGRRTSYDTFKFRNEKDMMAFLLRWT